MSDSDDDIPIIELIKKRKLESIALRQINVSTNEKTTKPSNTQSSSNAIKKVKAEPTASSSSAPRNYGWREFYEDTDKGKLVQRLLCRWWYAIEWPKMEDIGQPPPGFEALEGFPGVFISTKSDSLGTIIDLRDKSTCPCLRVLSTWSSEKLQDYCIKAYTTQMQVLEEHESSNTQLLLDLKAQLKEIQRINPAAADKEARKYNFSVAIGK